MSVDYQVKYQRLHRRHLLFLAALGGALLLDGLILHDQGNLIRVLETQLRVTASDLNSLREANGKLSQGIPIINCPHILAEFPAYPPIECRRVDGGEICR